MQWFHDLTRKIPDHARERMQAFARFVWHRYREDRCLETASVLSYTTIFAMVPLAAAVFGVLSAFPVFDAWSESLSHFLFSNFVPASANAVEQYLRQFADNASQLTTASALIFLASSLLLMKEVEDTFDRIWRVSVPRPGFARFLVYWAALTAGPVCAVASVAVSSWLLSFGDVDAALEYWLRWLPVALELGGFTVAYAMVPNCRVPARHALIGGTLATVMFETTKWGFGLYLREVPSYQQIYGALAAVPIFLIWVYLCWVVILLGASIAASLAAFRFQPAAARLPAGFELYGLLRLLGRFADAQQTGAALDREGLRRAEPALGDDLLSAMLAALAQATILQRTDRGGWVLARDPAALTLRELCAASGATVPLRMTLLPASDDALGRRALRVLHALDGAVSPHLDTPLAMLLRQPDPEPAP